jgi:hypothetical protein
VEKVKRSKPKARIPQAKAGDKSLKKKFIVIPDDIDDDDEIHSKAVDVILSRFLFSIVHMYCILSPFLDCKLMSPPLSENTGCS